MPLLFALTMFVSASLLFLVEPMVGKMILPLLGGTPAVWNTCMVFFQALLLLGYLYAHRVTADRPPVRQVTIHTLILGCAVAMLAIGATFSENHSAIPIVKSISPQGDEYPFFGVIVLLSVAVGLPFFVLCTSAPLLQKWFAETGHPSAKDPYFLYGASNFGSLLALIAYPALVEPNLRLVSQAWLFAGGYGLFFVLVMLCAKAVKKPIFVPRKGGNVAASTEDPPPTLRQKLRWLALAAVPSSLMLAVTTSISTDMASIPLLWIVPLSLYLITFILVFSHWGRHILTPVATFVVETVNAFGGNLEKPTDDHIFYVLLAPVAILLVAFTMTSHVGVAFRWLLLLYMVTFFIVSMFCHGELARSRPSTKYLTSFYLIMSLGGMLGGMFNGLAAPIVFDFISEYPITLIVACFLLPPMFGESKGGSWTPWLDAMVPLLVFTVCRSAQANLEELREFIYYQGSMMIAGTVAFLIPAGIAIFVIRNVEKSTRNRIGFYVLLGTVGLGYMLAWLPIEEFKSEHLIESVMAEPADTGYAVDYRFKPIDLLKFLPAILALLGFGIYRAKQEPTATWKQSLGLATAVVGAMLVSVFMLSEPIWATRFDWIDFVNKRVSSIWPDPENRKYPEIAQEMIGKIFIYGLPAMICYFFVERPRRFGAAVAALWLATFVTEMKTEYHNDLLNFRGKPGLAAAMFRDCDGPTTSTEYFYTRTFFGRMKIQPGDRRGLTVQLVHGTTVHGLQYRYSEAYSIKTLLSVMAPTNGYSCAATTLAVSESNHWRFPGRDPLTYYHRTGPVGSMFNAFYARLAEDPTANSDVACIGLGTGTLASYGLNDRMMRWFGRDGQSHRLTFFEIDQTVRRLVEPPKYFTYIDSARKQGVTIDFEMGDARITLERVNRKFGMMLIDAFSSDAIPAHLLTKQSLELYFSKLEEEGLLAIHISNRYMDLEPVVERIARELGVEARVMHGTGDDDTLKSASTWIALARKKEYLGPIQDATERWNRMVASGKFEAANGQTYPLDMKTAGRRFITEGSSYNIKDQWMTLQNNDDVGLWTDDYYSIISVLLGEWKFWKRN